MELRRDHPLIQWAYPGSDAPNRTSLCALFWRSIGVVPFWAVILAFVAVLAPFVGIKWCYDKLLKRRVDGLLERRYEWSRARRQRRIAKLYDEIPHEPKSRSLLWAGAKAIKAKFCPIVTIVRAEQ